MWALISNRLEGQRGCNPKRRWMKLLEANRQGPLWGTRWHHGRADRPHLVASWGPLWRGVFWCPLEPSGVVFIVVKFGSFWHFDPPFWFSRIILLKMQIHQNLWKLSVYTLKVLLVIHFKYFFKLNWRFVMNDNYRQQPSITVEIKGLASLTCIFVSK
jgi:hypothetical protein